MTYHGGRQDKHKVPENRNRNMTFLNIDGSNWRAEKNVTEKYPLCTALKWEYRAQTESQKPLPWEVSWSSTVYVTSHRNCETFSNNVVTED